MRQGALAIVLTMAIAAALPVLAQPAGPPGAPAGARGPGGPGGGPPPPMQPPSKNPADAPAGNYVLDKMHASVIANIVHQGMSNYAIRMSAVDASIVYDPAKPENSKITATIDSGSLDVGDAKIGPEFAQRFLESDKSPKITFTSTAVKAGPNNTGTMTGDLTIRGVTKPVTLNVTFNGTRGGQGPNAGKRLGFSATTTLKRSDFGIGAMMAPPALSDEVPVRIEVEFTQKQ